MNVESRVRGRASRDAIVATWPMFSEDDLEWIDGRLDRVFQSLVAHGLSRDEAARQIKDFVEQPAT